MVETEIQSQKGKFHQYTSPELEIFPRTTI